MEPVTKKIKISSEKPELGSADLWQYRENLRKKDEVIAQLEEEVAQLKECVTKLREELIGVTRCYGTAESEKASISAIVVKEDAKSSTNNQLSIEGETASDHDDSDDEEDGVAGENEFSSSGSIRAGRKGKWKRRFCVPLLQVYAKYKAELRCLDDAEEVWAKISHEIRGRCRTNYNGQQCMLKIEELREEYERLKNAYKVGNRKAKFFLEAKYAFESDANSVISSDTSKKWHRNRSLRLLQVYMKYKTQLSHPGVQERVVWKEIAVELRVKYIIDCNESECCSKVDELRSKYERMKNQLVPNEETAMFLDVARLAFETTETSVSIPDNNLLNVKKRMSGFRLRLLQVYAKYRRELSFPGVEEDKIWDKIAQEVREWSYNCGMYLCHYELSQMKVQYEYLKGDKTKKLFKPIDMRDLLQDARKAFED